MRYDKAEQILQRLYQLNKNQAVDKEQPTLGLEDLEPRDISKPS